MAEDAGIGALLRFRREGGTYFPLQLVAGVVLADELMVLSVPELKLLDSTHDGSGDGVDMELDTTDTVAVKSRLRKCGGTYLLLLALPPVIIKLECCSRLLWVGGGRSVSGLSVAAS